MRQVVVGVRIVATRGVDVAMTDTRLYFIIFRLLNRFISMIQTMVELQSRSEKQEGSLNADEGDMTPSDPHQPAILTETQKLRQRATHERNRSRSAEPKKIK